MDMKGRLNRHNLTVILLIIVMIGGGFVIWTRYDPVEPVEGSVRRNHGTKAMTG